MGKSSSKNPAAASPINTAKVKDLRNAMARDQIQDHNDSYLPEGAYKDDTVCTQCGAVYGNRHWSRDDRKRDMLLSAGVAHEVVCPGCKIIAERNPQGILTLSGDYWPAHRDDILNLVRNEEARGIQTNPIERIIDTREEEGALIIETTNEKLAQRIGRSIHKAHKGEIEYKWPDGNQLVRIYWERSLSNGH
jgi:hypothetical protein